MKRVINSSESTNEALDYFIEQLDSEAYNRGFKVVGKGWDVQLEPKNSDSISPKIRLHAIKTGPVQGFYPTLTMPDVTPESLDYADSAEYFASKYMNAAKLVTWLMTHSVEEDETLDYE